MNYIKHLGAFFNAICTDERLNSSHISLYLALFYYWNLNHFDNPITINRKQVLNMSKIGSLHTYYKRIRELHNFQYIRYIPSGDPSQSARIIMCTFETNGSKNAADTDTEMHPDGCKNAPVADAEMHPSINNNKTINNKTFLEEAQPAVYFNNPSITDRLNKVEKKDFRTKREKEPLKPQNVIPPLFEQVRTFFHNQTYPEIEAQKFFNHFQSNGWRVGGKAPMKDWHAAARNWMLNCNKFNPPVKQNPIHLNQNKNYKEPL